MSACSLRPLLRSFWRKPPSRYSMGRSSVSYSPGLRPLAGCGKPAARRGGGWLTEHVAEAGRGGLFVRKGCCRKMLGLWAFGPLHAQIHRRGD